MPGAFPIARQVLEKAAPSAASRVLEAPPHPWHGLEIPPLLLEGDEPVTPSREAPATRREAPVPRTWGVRPREELPGAAEPSGLLVMARDPHCIYVHWELSSATWQRFALDSVEGCVRLRVCAGGPDGPAESDSPIEVPCGHSFIQVRRAGTIYAAELGYYAPGGRWERIGVSQTLATPREAASGEAAIYFAAVGRPADLPVPALAGVREESGSAPQAAAGPAPVSAPRRAVEGWTAEQKLLFTQLVEEFARRQQMGSMDVVSREARLQPVPEVKPAEAAVGPSSLEWAAPVGEAAISSPAGGEMRPSQGFWFNVNAELVVYGATEPDAHVTIGGRPMRLRPDGSFSYRFALPDGQYELALAATSARGDHRQAQIRVSRATETRGEVGAHPQDAALRTPAAEHVT